MSHTFEYRGHQVQVDVSKWGKGGVWSHVLGAQTMIDCKDRPLRSDDLMLKRGIAAARHHIDRVEGSRYGPAMTRDDWLSQFEDEPKKLGPHLSRQQ